MRSWVFPDRTTYGTSSLSDDEELDNALSCRCLENYWEPKIRGRWPTLFKTLSLPLFGDPSGRQLLVTQKEEIELLNMQRGAITLSKLSRQMHREGMRRKI
jgi:hypothetical protein